tara:strand:+ start:872 stop:1279 length:408 start_codon:yes stop_codon:yes gene_type:complete
MTETVTITEPSIHLPVSGKKTIIISDDTFFADTLISGFESVYVQEDLIFYSFTGENYDWLLLNLPHIDNVIIDLNFKDTNVYWATPYLVDKFVILIGENNTIQKIINFGSSGCNIYPTLDLFLDTLEAVEDFNDS